jgi:hypothetical protein
MQVITKRTWELIDGNDQTGKGRVNVEPGTYEVERIPCPLGYDCNWLVLVGTLTGMAEGAWRQWTNGVLADMPGHPNFGKPIDWGEFEIQFID